MTVAEASHTRGKSVMHELGGRGATEETGRISISVMLCKRPSSSLNYIHLYWKGLLFDLIVL